MRQRFPVHQTTVKRSSLPTTVIGKPPLSNGCFSLRGPHVWKMAVVVRTCLLVTIRFDVVIFPLTRVDVYSSQMTVRRALPFVCFIYARLSTTMSFLLFSEGLKYTFKLEVRSLWRKHFHVASSGDLHAIRLPRSGSDGRSDNSKF